MSDSNDQENPLLNFRARFEALEKKLHERLLDTEKALQKCQKSIPAAGGYSFDEIAAHVDSWMMLAATSLTLDKPVSKGSSPSSAADILQIQMTYPDEGSLTIFGAFQLAIAYWVEATRSFRMGDYTRSLPALIVACQYLGMAGSPPSASEHLSEAMAKVHKNRTQSHRAEAVRLLNELTRDGGAESVGAMLTAIGPQFTRFNDIKREERLNASDDDKKHIWCSQSPDSTLEDWCEIDGRAPEVREAWLACKTAWKRANNAAPSKVKVSRRGRR